MRVDSAVRHDKDIGAVNSLDVMWSDAAAVPFFDPCIAVCGIPEADTAAACAIIIFGGKQNSTVLRICPVAVKVTALVICAMRAASFAVLDTTARCGSPRMICGSFVSAKTIQLLIREIQSVAHGSKNRSVMERSRYLVLSNVGKPQHVGLAKLLVD